MTVEDIGVEADQVGLDGSPTMVVDISTARPRARAQLVIDASLPAHERIKLIMRGGIQKKLGGEQLEGGIQDLSKKAGDFILEHFRM
jgi:hypothetical protein